MNVSTNSQKAVMNELVKEAQMGGIGEETFTREVRCIDFSNFAQRKEEIADQLWAAATDIGFFQVSHHGIPLNDIHHAFSLTETFFSLPEQIKAQYPLSKNAGWENKSQVRPSTQTADQKESYQITRPRMEGLWPTEQEFAGFKADMLQFESQCWALGMNILSCFALKLGFPEAFFTQAHDPSQTSYQSTLRLLHYYATEQSQAGLWRAGAHTDFDCLTLLFQRPGQGGLQVCPGKEHLSQQWTSIEPREDVITCNIGDMLMRWSDDQLPSNFHRVRSPLADEYQGARYSMAFFCQANKEIEIVGPAGKYPPITAEAYLQQRISANFSK
ncbi:isopenicillin N synthase family dioxygenase [Rosenbergiella metrosideri]|uniref:isopenicillin N synthase family dioxygenase n=1 Tax=Rosenbergiella metrosideri TaxID=2921185 RepID=UPI001F4FFBA1|nr:2OG-Fe(II) oxygenase family protein [Rosenbergiella metrosideri]